MWSFPEDGEMTFNPNAIEMIEIKKVMTDSSRVPGVNISLAVEGIENLEDRQNLLENLQMKYLIELSSLLDCETRYSRFNFGSICRELEKRVSEKYFFEVLEAKRVEVTEIHDKVHYQSPDLFTIMNIDHSIAIQKAKIQYLKQIH